MQAEQILQRAADEGELDSEEWPRTLEYILTRLDEIIDDFPKPPVHHPPPQDQAPSSTHGTPSRPQNASLSSQESQTADKENAPPPATPPSRPPVPNFDGTPSASQEPQPSFPADVLAFYASIKSTLSTNFPKNPPHTVQRLAELILQPKRRYDYLPPYLRALDRVISVSSSTNLFPLPIAILPSTTASGALLNGTASTPTSNLGSDESLGGALLTPIPWLRNNQNNQTELISESTELVQGPNGTGRIETVSVINGQLTSTTASNGSSPTSSTGTVPTSQPASETSSLADSGPITQGELLRQEQEAGVVVSNPRPIPSQRTEPDSNVMETTEGEEEVPHARGPEEIGMEDMGPQSSHGPGLDLEAAVGRPAVGRETSRSPGQEGEKKDEEMAGTGEEGEKKKKTEEAGKTEDEEMKGEE